VVKEGLKLPGVAGSARQNFPRARSRHAENPAKPGLSGWHGRCNAASDDPERIYEAYDG
jgi:hypothetical protein